MATKNAPEETPATDKIDQAPEEIFVQAKALINLKYDKTVVKIGQVFSIKKEDAESIVKNGYAEIIGKK